MPPERGYIIYKAVSCEPFFEMHRHRILYQYNIYITVVALNAFECFFSDNLDGVRGCLPPDGGWSDPQLVELGQDLEGVEPGSIGLLLGIQSPGLLRGSGL